MRNLTKIVERLEQLDREATKGPWKSDAGVYQDPEGEGPDMWFARGPMVKIRGYKEGQERIRFDSDCMATTRNLLPLLIAALKVTVKAVEQDRAWRESETGDGYTLATNATEQAARDFAALLAAQEAK